MYFPSSGERKGRSPNPSHDFGIVFVAVFESDKKYKFYFDLNNCDKYIEHNVTMPKSCEGGCKAAV